LPTEWGEAVPSALQGGLHRVGGVLSSPRKGWWGVESLRTGRGIWGAVVEEKLEKKKKNGGVGVFGKAALDGEHDIETIATRRGCSREKKRGGVRRRVENWILHM